MSVVIHAFVSKWMDKSARIGSREGDQMAVKCVVCKLGPTHSPTLYLSLSFIRARGPPPTAPCAEPSVVAQERGDPSSIVPSSPQALRVVHSIVGLRTSRLGLGGRLLWFMRGCADSVLT